MSRVTIYSLDVLLYQFGKSVVPCPVLTAASWPAHRFLRRQVRCPGIPISWRIFHSLLWSTQSVFGMVNKAEVDVFLELSCFIDDPMDVGSFVPLPFLNSTWTSGSSWFTYYWSLAWRIGFWSQGLSDLVLCTFAFLAPGPSILSLFIWGLEQTSAKLSLLGGGGNPEDRFPHSGSIPSIRPLLILTHYPLPNPGSIKL